MSGIDRGVSYRRDAMLSHAQYGSKRQYSYCTKQQKPTPTLLIGGSLAENAKNLFRFYGAVVSLEEPIRKVAPGGPILEK